MTLQQTFRDQAAFAAGYSPLYAQLFAIVAGWLDDPADPVAAWLLDAAADRQPIDVTLLLAAALHRDVLAGEREVEALGRFFATTAAWGSGEQRSGGAEESAVTSSPLHPISSAPHLPIALRAAILARRQPLAAFILRENVQTNETGRGLAWLLPVAALGWEAVHLVELGASAGLNLAADQRVYRLAAADDPDRTLLQLGDGEPQFTALVRGAAELPPAACCPAVLSRMGGDMAPFHLRTADDELRLASFIWGDQPQRIARLHEGIAALRRVESSAAPVRLRTMRLPDDLPAFLAAAVPASPAAPIVLFNTVVTMYLPDRGASLHEPVAAWAAAQPVPVLWLQWEGALDGSEPPEPVWMAWTADYWPADPAAPPRRYRLGWAHPHGTAVEWGQDWPEFLGIPMQS